MPRQALDDDDGNIQHGGGALLGVPERTELACDADFEYFTRKVRIRNGFPDTRGTANGCTSGSMIDFGIELIRPNIYDQPTKDQHFN